MDLRTKIIESVKKGVPKGETARRFGVDRAPRSSPTAKGSNERGTLEPDKTPAKRPKLDEKASTSYSLRTSETEAVCYPLSEGPVPPVGRLCGVRVSEATICRAIKRLSHRRKKDLKERQSGRSS